MQCSWSLRLLLQVGEIDIDSELVANVQKLEDNAAGTIMMLNNVRAGFSSCRPTAVMKGFEGLGFQLITCFCRGVLIAAQRLLCCLPGREPAQMGLCELHCGNLEREFYIPLPQGCLCCTVRDDLIDMLTELVRSHCHCCGS